MSLHAGQPAINDVLRALANGDRRRLLLALKDRPPQDEVPVSEVAQSGEETIDVLRQRFHHTHLPLLDTCGLITWNREDNVVSKGPNFDDIRPMLEPLKEFLHRRPDGLV